MMITQGTTASDLQGVSALLAIISDPTASAKRLKDLVAASIKAQEDEQAAVDAENHAQEIVDAANDIKTKQDSRETQLNILDKSLQEQSTKLKDDITTHLSNVAKWNFSVAATEGSLAGKTQEFSESVQKANAQLVQREADVSAREVAAEQLISEYTQKLAALKQLVV